MKVGVLMTDNELLLAISDMLDKKLKAELQPIKDDIQAMKAEMQLMKADIVNIKLHIQNVTDKNISILAENHIALVDKLNQSLKVADKDLLYEIKVNYLEAEVKELRREIDNLKNKIA